MKQLFALFIATCLTVSSVSIAKAQVNVSINIGAQPLWGPAGYDAVDYYYLPDLEMYYYVPRHQFIYMSNNNWVFVSSLPARYRGYDLYSGYKVVINEPKPYLHFNNHKVVYAKYKGWKGKQGAIRDSRDPKYYVVKGHPGNKGNKPVKVKEHGGGPGNSPGKSHGQGHGGGKGKKG